MHVKERCLVVYQHLQGLKNKEISKLNCLSNRTISRYIKIYTEGGIAALKPNFSNGAPRRVSPHIETLMSFILENEAPKDLYLPNGYHWKIFLVRHLLKLRFNIDLSKSAVHVFMHRIKFSYTMPTYTLARASKTKQLEFKKDSNNLENNFIMTI